MIKYARKFGLLGMGLLSITKKRAESMANALIKEGEISSKEGSAFVKDLLKKSEVQRKELERRINREIRNSIKAMGLASKDDIKRLEKRIKKLEAKKRQR